MGMGMALVGYGSGGVGTLSTSYIIEKAGRVCTCFVRAADGGWLEWGRWLVGCLIVFGLLIG